MATSRAAVLDALWAVADGADDEAELHISPTALAQTLACTPEDVGSWLSELGAGRRKLRGPDGRRVTVRVIRIRDLPRPTGQGPREAPPPAEIAPASAWASLLSPVCRHCAESLLVPLRHLGICGSCLQDRTAAAASQPVAGPSYGVKVGHLSAVPSYPGDYHGTKSPSYGARKE
jgi:hypothetical protein